MTLVQSLTVSPNAEPLPDMAAGRAPSRRLTLNVATNTLSTLLNAVCGFLILPFLISKLGRDGYGIWTLIVASAGYFLILDFGVSGAVGRLVAGHKSKNDVLGVNTVISTTALLMLAVGCVVAGLSYIIAIPFFALFEVPVQNQEDIRQALLIVGLTTALSFPGMISYGFLWGYERFDLHNLIEIPVVLARTGLTLFFITTGSSLVELAYIVSGTSVAGYVLRTALCWWVEPQLKVRPLYFSKSVLREMFVYGIWFGMLSFSRSILPNIAPFVTGHYLGPTAVTTYTIPRMLAAYTNWVVVSGTQAAAPKAAVYHFANDSEKQRDLFILGGRYTWALSVFVMGGAILFGYDLLGLWQNAPQEQEYRLLLILMAGELIPLSQWITYNMIVSMGVHRPLAIMGVLECLCVLGLSALLVRTHQLEGVAVAAALAGFLFRGVFQLVYGCRFIQVSLWRYFQSVFLPVAIYSIPAFVMMGFYRLWITPDTWPWLIISSALYAGVYAIFVISPLRKPSRVQSLGPAST